MPGPTGEADPPPVTERRSWRPWRLWRLRGDGERAARYSTAQRWAAAIAWTLPLAPTGTVFADALPAPIEAIVRPFALPLALAIWMLFALRCRSRRLTLALVALVLLVGHGLTGWIGVVGVGATVAAPAVLALAAEAWRQNRPLVVALRTSDTRLLPLLGQAFILWTPALLFGAVGLLANQALTRLAEQAVYRTGLASPHCEMLHGSSAYVAHCSSGVARFVPLPEAAGFGEVLRQRAQRLRRDLPADLGTDADWAPERRQASFARLCLKSIRELYPAGAGKAGAAIEPSTGPAQALQHDLCTPSQWGKFNGFELIARMSKVFPKREEDMTADQLALALRVFTLFDKRLGFGEMVKALEAPGTPAELHERMAAGWLKLLALAPATGRAMLEQMPEGKRAGLRKHGLWSAQCRVELQELPEPQRPVVDCPADLTDAEWTSRPLPLLASVRASIDERSAAQASEVDAAIDGQAAAARASIAGTQTALRETVGRIPPAMGLDERLPRCGIDPFCLLGNAVLRRVERGYEDVRAGTQNELRSRLDAAAADAKGQVGPFADRARVLMHREIERSRSLQQETVVSLGRAYDTVGTLLAIYLVFVLFKSFLYVLALVIFHERGPLDIGFDLPAAPQGRFEQQQVLSVRPPEGQALWTFGVGINQVKRLRPWKPWVAFWHRLPRLKWLMNFGGASGQAQLQFPLDPGHTGVLWHLAPAERVVFRFPEMLGFSDNVRVRTVISLRLSTLLLGGYFFRIAECRRGNGLLLLNLKGSHVPSDDAVETFPLARLKAWSQHARFRAAGDASLLAVLKDGYTLRRVGTGAQGKGRVLVGAAGGAGMQFEGLVSFAKALMSPF